MVECLKMEWNYPFYSITSYKEYAIIPLTIHANRLPTSLTCTNSFSCFVFSRNLIISNILYCTCYYLWHFRCSCWVRIWELKGLEGGLNIPIMLNHGNIRVQSKKENIVGGSKIQRMNLRIICFIVFPTCMIQSKLRKTEIKEFSLIRNSIISYNTILGIARNWDITMID